MSWAMVAGAAVSVVGGAINSRNQRKGQDAAQAGLDAATAEQGRQYDQSREDMQPWLQAGQGALGQMQALNSGDFSSFTKSPDYQFSLDQGMQALDRGAAAQGNYRSGGTDADRLAFSQGLASQNYGQFYNRLAGMAGVGQTASNNLANLGSGYANAVGQNAMAGGQLQQSGYQQRADNNNQMLGGLLGGFNNWYQGQSANNGGGSGWYVGNQPGVG